MNFRQPVQELGLQNTKPGEPVYDARGIEVRVGDTLAIGARIGNSGVLKLGTVTGFDTRNEGVYPRKYPHEWVPGTGGWDKANELPRLDFAVTVKVLYEQDPDYPKDNRKGYVRAYDRKFVVIGEALA